MTTTAAEAVAPPEAVEVLRRCWGYDAFRAGQDQAVASVLSGRDTLTIMPTGGGKSLCYQIPALLLPGITVVVSPLISLMKDQVDALDAAGVPATFINSSISAAEIQARLDAARRGAVKLLYVAPERFDGDYFTPRLAGLRVSLLAVDEAHCVSEWGHDFRPSYLRLGGVREMLGGPPIAALTATATPDVRRDIVRQLGLREPATVVTGFDRRNLVWHVARVKNDSEKDRRLLKLLRGASGSAIVYASTRKNVDALTALLRGVGVGTVGYHAGLPDADRKRVQEAFMSGAVPVVVATNAFGMGIDKPDVRLVVHYNMPGNLEAYYQEAGRAGRDGAEAHCVLLHAYADRFTHEFFLDQSQPPREVIERVYEALRRAADGAGRMTDPLADFAAMVRGAKGERQVGAALRVLEEYGAVRLLAGSDVDSVWVRLLATPDRIRREISPSERAADLTLLRAIWRASGGADAHRGAEVSWQALTRAIGGSRGAVVDRLDVLRAEGFADWRDGGGEGYEVLDPRVPASRLQIDWRTLEAKRGRELRKLQRMQGYAYEDGCRRGYVLRYFGDPAAMAECGACDCCLGGHGELADRLAGGAEPPSAPRTKRPRATAAAPSGASRAAPPPPTAEEAALYVRLRDLRTELARRDAVPAYCVFADRTLIELARQRPCSRAAMLAVAGVGPAKLDKYGDAFLALLGGAD